VKTFAQSLVAVALFAGSVIPCAAKDEVPAADSGNKPVAVVTLASYDRLMTDIAFVGNLAGNPDLDKNIEGAIQLFTQGQGLNGLDKKRPVGLILTTDGQQFQPLLIIPVSDLKQLLESLAGLIGEAQDAPDGAFELNVFGQKIFVKEQNKWAFVAQTPEAFTQLPKDPAKLMASLNKSYDIAARVYIQNVPDLYRSMFIDQMRAGVERGLARQEDESDEDFAARKKVVEGQADFFSKLVKEIDELTLGVALDVKSKTAHVDLSVSAVAGSDSAKSMATMQNTTSDFAGFLVPDAAASLSLTVKVAKEDAGQIAAGLASFRAQAMQHIESEPRLADDASKTLAKEMVGQIFDAIQSTLESGRVDAGATLNLDGKAMSVVAGVYVSEPKKLEDALKKFAKLMEKDPDFAGFKFNADQHAGIRFHTTTIPVPKDEDVSKILGEKLDVAVGIGPKAVYLAVGTDSLKLCKTLIDKSKADASKKLPPFQLNVSLAPIFQFASAMQDRPEIRAMAEELAKSQGKDKVRIVIMPDSNAVTLRIEAQEAVLQLLGTAFRQAGGIPGLGQ
jgi:hypothetical protein